MDSLKSQSESMIHSVKAVLNQLGRFDIQGLREFLQPEVVLEWPFRGPGVPGTIVGRDSVLAALGQTPRMFKSFQFTPTAFYPSPESKSLIVEAVSSGQLKSGGNYSNR